MVEDIKVILLANENLTPEVREDLLELITLFNKNFKEVSLETLKERLKTLSIQRASMYLVKVPCKYIPHNNEIAINSGLMDEADGRHWLMHSLLGLITAQGNHYGFNDDNDSLVALNEGYTEIITNNLVGDVDNNFYTDEIIMTNLISKVIGPDILYDAYFKNDSSSVVKAMMEAEAK
jgi:hypothetical protein